MTKSFVCNTAVKPLLEPLVKPQDFKFKLYVRATYSITTRLSLRRRRVALFVFANVRSLKAPALRHLSFRVPVLAPS